jgi:hypothetical protein
MWGHFTIGATSGCCGVMQIYGFSSPLGLREPPDHIRTSAFMSIGDTADEVYQDMFDKLCARIVTNYSGYTMQIWFRKSRGAKSYSAQKLMELIQTIPDVIDLGCRKNPNTGNTIQGYQFVLKKQPKPKKVVAEEEKGKE